MLAVALNTAILHVAKLGLVTEVLTPETLHGFIGIFKVLDSNQKVVDSLDSMEFGNVFF